MQPTKRPWDPDWHTHTHTHTHTLTHTHTHGVMLHDLTVYLAILCPAICAHSATQWTDHHTCVTDSHHLPMHCWSHSVICRMLAIHIWLPRHMPQLTLLPLKSYKYVNPGFGRICKFNLWWCVGQVLKNLSHWEMTFRDFTKYLVFFFHVYVDALVIIDICWCLYLKSTKTGSVVRGLRRSVVGFNVS